MTVRTFIFCDTCNSQGIRSPEQRRNINRDERDGRRSIDGRSWFEGSLDIAIASYGWAETSDGLHICPRCVANGLAKEPQSANDWLPPPATFL